MAIIAKGRGRAGAVVLVAAALGWAGAARAEILIGLAGPVTGAYAVFGEQMRRGAERAVAAVNAAGGIGGEPLRLTIGDDACDPKQAVAVANQMVAQGVVFVDGHYCSSSSIPASQIYSEAGVLQITPASNSSKLTDQGLANVFRTCGRDDVQGRFTADYIADKHVAERIAIVHDKTTFGKGLADQVKAALNARGVGEVAYEAVTQGDKDFTALVTKLKQLNVQLIYYGGYHTEAGLITRQARDQGLTAIMMSGSALIDRQYWTITGASGEGTLMTFAPDPRKRPAAAEVVRQFEVDGFDPEGFTLYTYAAIQVFAEAARQAHGTGLEAITAQLHAGSFETVLGPLSFDAKGDVAHFHYCVFRWHNGAYEQLYCPPAE